MAYGTKINGDFAEAEAIAVKRHSHYYTDVEGWLFRVDTVRYAYCLDPDGDVWGSTDPTLEVQAYPVLRWTPCGATVKDIWGGKGDKWVDLRPNAKQWASRSVREAIEQLQERRRRQIWVLERKLSRARDDHYLTARALLQSPLATVPEIV